MARNHRRIIFFLLQLYNYFILGYFIIETPSIEIPSSSDSVKPKSVILEEINEVLQQILMEELNTDSSEDEDTSGLSDEAYKY